MAEGVEMKSRLPIPPRPLSGLQGRASGNERSMTDEQDRERESQSTDENKFVELQEEVADETRQAAERLANDPVVNEAPADES
jgi:hypothetical protein